MSLNGTRCKVSLLSGIMQTRMAEYVVEDSIKSDTCATGSATYMSA